MGILRSYILPHPPLLIPEIGRGQEKSVQPTIDAYHTAAKEIGELAPETIVVISPHSIMYGDYIHISPHDGAKGDFRKFGAQEVKFSASYDTEMVSELSKEAEECGIYAGTLGEKEKSLDHGTMVPLYFIDQYCKAPYKIIRVSISGLSATEHYEFGRCLANVIKRTGRRTVIVASGDLSHRLKDEGAYEFAPEGPAFDEQVTEAMKTADFLKFLTFDPDFTEAAGECGLRSFIIMAGALDRLSVKAQFLSYEGTFGVGYAVCAFTPAAEDEDRNFGDQYTQVKKRELEARKANEDAYVRLARLSLETFVREKRYAAAPDGLPPEMLNQRAGVFVSLKKDGRLRGCIGTISATQDCVAEEILKNAVSAGVGDTRFDPVEAHELPQLVYSVDVLGEAEPIRGIEQLDTKRYGVIVRKGRRSGLLLPNLAGIDDATAQVEIALQKGGISPHEDYDMQRFEVIRHY